MTEPKPLNWTAAPGVGMSVVRRGDGGIVRHEARHDDVVERRPRQGRIVKPGKIDR